MSKESLINKTHLVSLLAIVAVAAALALAVRLLVPVEGIRPAAQTDRATQDHEKVLAYMPAGTDVVTTTVYLPLAARHASRMDPVFGIQFQSTIDDAHGLAQAVRANMFWVRFAAFDWNRIEPVRTEPPTYDWSVVDEQSIINAAAHGMELVAIVRFAPQWALPAGASACGPIPQAALDEYAQFLTTLVRRYRLPPYNVSYWELGNEPDVDPSLVGPDSGFGCWGDKNDPYYGGGYYADMLRSAYPAIKAGDPTAQVLIGGLLLDCDPENPPSGKDCTPSKFLEGILLNGGGPYFDIVSFHAYTYFLEAQDAVGNPNWPGSITSIPEKAAFLHGVLGRYGFGDKSLMNTEAALLCFDATSACREKQARYIARAYAEALAMGLTGQVYFALVNDSWRYTGLLETNLAPRPAYNAYVAATSFLTSVSFQGTATSYPASIQGYTFHQQSQPWYIDVIWSADGSSQSVTLPAGATAYDHYGGLVASTGTIQVTDAPVYIKRP